MKLKYRKKILKKAGKNFRGGGRIFVQIENREEFEGGKKERKRGEKKKTKKRGIKHTLKYLYEA